MDATIREEMHRKISTWLLDEGFAIKREPDPSSFFNYGVDLNGFNLNVIHSMHGVGDRLQISANVTISPEHQKMLSDMGSQERDRFLWDLRFMLAANGIEFALLDAASKPNLQQLAHILVVQTVWYDGLTKDRFMLDLRTVKLAGMMTAWSFLRRQGAPIIGFDPMLP